MKTRTPRLLALTMLLGLILTGAASAQDFNKSYRVGAGGSVRVGTVSGDVSVTGYDGDAIVVTATKKGSDTDLVEIEDKSTPGGVNISVRYPKNCNCDVSVNFKVRVPRSVSYNFEHISSVSGDVEVSDVSVDINELEGADSMTFSSVSGDVQVRVPSHLAADVDMSSFSGSVRTNFPLEVQEERHGSRRWARGLVGEGGARRLKMSSVSGDLSLQHP